MMKNELIHLRVDKDLKQWIDSYSAELGERLSTVVRGILRDKKEEVEKKVT